MVLCLKARESRSPPGLPNTATHIPYKHTQTSNAASSQTRRYLFKQQNTPTDAGWSSPVARQAHNLKVAGSNPAPATKDSLVIVIVFPTLILSPENKDILSFFMI